MSDLHYLPPTEQTYKSYASSAYYGFALSRYFAQRFDYLSESEWKLRIQSGMITVNGEQVEPDYIIKAHDLIVTRMGLRVEPPANRTLSILYEDNELRVFNKGAPIPVHPSGRFFKNSFTELLKETYPEETPRPVQRLDSTTTGVIVFAKTREVASALMKEFAENRVYKEYLAVVDGEPEEKDFHIDAPIGKIKGSARGIGELAQKPKPAKTRVIWLNTLERRSLLKVIPLSGRTNQIRVHLASVGCPVYNDKVYGNAVQDLCDYGLHAYRLKICLYGRDLDFKAPWPNHFQPFIDRAEISL